MDQMIMSQRPLAPPNAADWSFLRLFPIIHFPLRLFRSSIALLISIDGATREEIWCACVGGSIHEKATCMIASSFIDSHHHDIR